MYKLVRKLVRNISKAIIITLCASSALHPLQDNEKTALTLRDHQLRAANFTTFHELQTKKEKKFGAKFQNGYFYRETENSEKLGEVFGTCDTNKIIVGTELQVAAELADVENNFILHYHSSPNTLEGIVEFNPKQTSHGTIAETFMKLDRLLKGLYLKKKVVIMEVENSLNAKVYNKEPGAAATEAQLLSDVLAGKNLKRNLGGGASDRYSEQEALEYAKIGCPDETRTGIENLETTIGWHFIRHDDYMAGINIALQSPTGDRTTAEYLWEPRLGSQHWALGGGIEGKVTAWKDENQSIRVFLDINYRYEFEAKEKRTLGIKNAGPLNHYILLGEVGKYMLYPAANILTKEIDVTPGSNLDALLVLNYNFKKFTFDLGYNFFYKVEEDVELNRCLWTDDKYGIADPSWTTCNSAFTLADTFPANTPINYDDIDTSVAQSPGMLSHSIFASAGYSAKIWNSPIMLALGGAYEFSGSRGTAKSFTIWGKAGFAF